MVDNRFDSSLWKLDRARKHAADLASEAETFMAASPCQVESVGNGPDGAGRLRVAHVIPLPSVMSMIAGDAAHNIRSALDHFAWAAADPSVRNRQTCFPIGNGATAHDRDKWRSQVERQLRGATPQLISAVEAMEPWQGGRDQHLWMIHELDRIDKHRLHLSLAASLTGIAMHGDSYALTVAKKFSGAKLDAPLALEPIAWTPVAEDTVLVLPLADAGIGVTETSLTFGIMFSEPPALRKVPAALALGALADAAGETIRNLSLFA